MGGEPVSFNAFQSEIKEIPVYPERRDYADDPTSGKKYEEAVTKYYETTSRLKKAIYPSG